jgi:hypothetical protein
MKIFSGALPKKKPPEGGCHLDVQSISLSARLKLQLFSI